VYKLNRRDVDLVALAEEIGARVGRPVALTDAWEPGAAEGLLIVTDPETGVELDVDAPAVQAAVAAHTPPPPEPDPLDQLQAALAGATTVAKLRDALGSYAAAEKRRRLVPDRLVPLQRDDERPAQGL
jgi:hypothetical protein